MSIFIFIEIQLYVYDSSLDDWLEIPGIGHAGQSAQKSPPYSGLPSCTDRNQLHLVGKGNANSLLSLVVVVSD